MLENLLGSMGRLEQHVGDLHTALEPLGPSMSRLDEDVTSLHTAVAPISRIADRVPLRRGRKS